MARIKVGKRRKPMMVTHNDEKKRELQSRMKVLLDFLNKDIDALNPIEFMKLFLDFSAFIYLRSGFDFFRHTVSIEPESDSIEKRKFLKISQRNLREMLEEILMAEKQIGQESNATAPRSFNMYKVHYYVWVTKDTVHKSRDFFTPHWSIFDREDEEIQELYFGLLTDALIDVLNPFPLSRIKTCQKPDCGNYFFQKTTKSKGDFCSPKCKNWGRVKRWRKANPDKYNAYHRKRRNKAKEPWIKMICFNCGHEYPKGHPDLGVCSKCEGKLKYEVQFLEGREWKSEQCRNLNEAEELRKEILEFEKSEGRETNGER